MGFFKSTPRYRAEVAEGRMIEGMMDSGQVGCVDERRMGGRTEEGRQVRRRFLDTQQMQRELRFLPGPQVQRVELDALAAVAAREPGRLQRDRLGGGGGTRTVKVHIEAHHLLAEPGRHSVRIDVPSATARERHR